MKFSPYDPKELTEAQNAAHRGLLQVIEIYENDVVFFRDLHLCIKRFYRDSEQEFAEVELRGTYVGRVSASRFTATMLVSKTTVASYWGPTGEGVMHKTHVPSRHARDVSWRWLDPGKLINPVQVSPAFDSEVATGCHLGDRTTKEWIGSVVHGEYAPTNYVPTAM